MSAGRRQSVNCLGTRRNNVITDGALISPVRMSHFLCHFLEAINFEFVICITHTCILSFDHQNNVTRKLAFFFSFLFFSFSFSFFFFLFLVFNFLSLIFFSFIRNLAFFAFIRKLVHYGNSVLNDYFGNFF